MKNLLAIGTDSKTVKGQSQGILTGILYMSPAIQSDGIDLCPFRTKQCTAACLNTSGRGAFSNVQAARLAKRELFIKDLPKFLSILESDLLRLERKAARLKMVPAVRLNGTTDIRWDKIARDLMLRHPKIRFYDYTKNPNTLKASLPKNYDVTYSRGEGRDQEAINQLKNGSRVAIVFSTKKAAPLPETWNGFKVIDGDNSDARFLDPAGVVIGLRAKGKAKNINPDGFVVAA